MRRLSCSLIGAGLFSGLLALPAVAHKTEVSGNVAGVWHLEPNHSPKAGDAARVWVALTQRGGQVIALEQCDCRLAIYATGSEDTVPVMEPTLEPVAAENYQGIPGAEITFPDLGEYRLVLTGSPQAGATFTPFELSYTTVVAAGRSGEAVSPQPESPQPEETVAQPAGEAEPVATKGPPGAGAMAPAQAAQASTVTWWIIGGVGSVLAILVAVGAWLRQGKRAKR